MKPSRSNSHQACRTYIDIRGYVFPVEGKALRVGWHREVGSQRCSSTYIRVYGATRAFQRQQHRQEADDSLEALCVPPIERAHSVSPSQRVKENWEEKNQEGLVVRFVRVFPTEVCLLFFYFLPLNSPNIQINYIEFYFKGIVRANSGLWERQTKLGNLE